MIRTTRWSPATCACVIEYTWDDAVSEDKRTHTVSNVLNRCAEAHPEHVMGAQLEGSNFHRHHSYVNFTTGKDKDGNPIERRSGKDRRGGNRPGVTERRLYPPKVS